MSRWGTLTAASIAMTLAGAVSAQPDACAAGALDVPLAGSAHLRFESDPPGAYSLFDGFVVRYDRARNLPAYTVHALRPAALDAAGRPPAVRRSSYSVYEYGGRHSATARDYAGSGFDRGHLVPAGDFVWDQAAKDETFTYANVAPFTPYLNRGAWAQLERAVRARVSATDAEAYVVTGALFLDGQRRMGPDSLEVPSHFFKAALFPRRAELFAFLFDNTVSHYEGRLSDFQVPVDFLEEVTGEDFFDRLADPCEDALESTVRPLDGTEIE